MYVQLGYRHKGIKKNKEQYAIWKIEQMVNFGLNGEKIKQEELLKYWLKLNIDPARRRFLEIILEREPAIDEN